MFEKILKNKYSKNFFLILLLFITGIFSSTAVYLIRNTGINNRPHDGRQYAKMLSLLKENKINTLKDLNHSDYSNCEMLSRFLRPLYSLSGMIFFLEKDEKKALFKVSVIYYIFSGILVYLILYLLSGDIFGSFIGGLLYYFHFISLNYGLNVLAESGSHFFFFLIVLCDLKFFYLKKDISVLDILLTGFVCGIGFLMKENTLAGSFFCGFLILFSNNKFLKKIYFAAILILSFLLPVLLWQFYSQKEIGYTLWQWLSDSYISASQLKKFTLLRFFIGLLITGNILFLPSLINLLQEKKNRLLISLFFISGIIPLFMAKAFHDRTFFYILPAFLIPSVKVLSDWMTKKKVIVILFLLFFIFINISMFFIYNNNNIYKWLNSVLNLSVNVNFP